MSLVRLRLDPLALEAGIAVGGAVRLTKPSPEHDLKGPQAMTGLLVGEPALLDPTHEGAARCTFESLRDPLPQSAEKLPDGKSSAAWLREHTLRGVRERFPGAGTAPPAVLAQIDCELARIDELDSGGYVLTMWGSSATAGARRSSARAAGSAASSVVCSCVRITAVDPTRVELLFERLLSRERHEPPDIDLDICTRGAMR